MKQKTTQTLYAYWDELRLGRIAPRRLEIEPSRIGSILPETFMLERTDATCYRYRLAGTRLCEVFGAELRGADLLAGWSASDRMSIAADLATTCKQGAVTLLTLEAATDVMRRIQLEVILLPLMHSDDKIDRVLGAMSPLSSPHWLGYERLTEKRLIDHDLIWPDGRPHSLLERAGQVPLFRRSHAGPIARNERPIFRVYDGGRSKG